MTLEQETDDTEKCPTHLLDDSPAEEDAFAIEGELGPHERVANAIAEMIESEEKGGKAIGLEGGWGSGKSTVVSFLNKRFSKNDDQPKDHALIVFDAWAHEGDPLRRTFIESIAEKLFSRDIGWCNKPKWGEKLDILANRLKKTTTRVGTNPTALGSIMAVSLLFIPVGTSFLSVAINDGVTIGWGNPINWKFLIGSLCIFCPLVVVGLFLWFQWFLSGIMKYVPTCQWAQRIQLNMSSSPWALLTKQSDDNTVSESIESQDPTSIEFGKYFTELMQDSLNGNPKRRLLLVLDNLDRVEADTAKSIWGTLQTFLHQRPRESAGWFDQLWVIVPYDPQRIKHLWDTPVSKKQEESSDDDKKPVDDYNSINGSHTTESFLDKSFQVRFRVAPPVLSDWKTFLNDKFGEALPNHKDKEEQHTVYRVFDNHLRARKGNPPTPRELILYINQLGSIHRQWDCENSIPLSHMAYFVLAERKYPNLIHALRSRELPSDEDKRLLGDNLLASLAGLTFNVEPKKGLELLLTDSITDALTDPSGEKLTALEELHGKAFWTVIEIVAISSWSGMNADSICFISRCLLASGLLDSHNGEECKSILTDLSHASKQITKWEPFGESIVDGISDLLILQANRDFSESIFLALSNQLKNSIPNTTRPVDLISSLLKALDRLFELGHSDIIPSSIVVPYQKEKWLAASNHLHKIDVNNRYRNRIRPMGEFSDVSESLESKISDGSFKKHYIVAITVTNEGPLECDWSDVAQAFHDRLLFADNVEPQEAFLLQCGLLKLIQLEVPESTELRNKLVEGGHISHHFFKATSQSNLEAQVICLINFLAIRPELGKQPGKMGRSDEGFSQIENLFASLQEDTFVNEFISLLKKYDTFDRIFEIIVASETYPPFLVSVLRFIADSESPADLFTPGVIEYRWEELLAELNDDEDSLRFSRLICHHDIYQSLCDYLSQGEHKFTPDCAVLYLELVRGVSDHDNNFLKWLEAGLTAMDKDKWIEDLTDDFICCQLCLELIKNKCIPDLSTSFTSALDEHSQKLINSESVPPEEVFSRWLSLLDCIQPGSRKVLREKIIDNVSSAAGEIGDVFFSLYGKEINDPKVLISNPRILSQFFSPLVEKRNIGGLKWLRSFLKTSSGFLDTIEELHTLEDFRAWIQNCINSPVEDDAQEIIEEIASQLNIESTIQDDEPDDENEVSLAENTD